MARELVSLAMARGAPPTPSPPHPILTSYWLSISLSGRYEGEWADGKMEGKGRYYFYNGWVYLGQVSTSPPSSPLTSPSYLSSFFTCAMAQIEQFSHGKRHGRGVLWSADKTHKHAGRPAYHILTTIPSSSTHTHTPPPPTGEWRNGQMHGKGVYSYPDGSRCKGIWANHHLQTRVVSQKKPCVVLPLTQLISNQWNWHTEI